MLCCVKALSVMDDLLREFLTETSENLDTVDVELVRFEQEPNNAAILGNIFRLVHTIKGTCGFLNLPRLEALTHAAEALMDRFRNGMPVRADAVSLVLATLDRVKDLLEELERNKAEPAGDDDDLISRLHAMVAEDGVAPARAATSAGTLVYQVLERPLRPGEATLDELERAFRETPGPAPRSSAPKSSTSSPSAPKSSTPPAARERQPADLAPPGPAVADRDAPDKASADQVKRSIRVQLDTLEHLMTMVSELVLTRNQLLEIDARHGISEFRSPLQQLSNATAALQDGIMKTRMQPISTAWQKLPRIVRDLSTELGKHIELEMQGGDTELDRQVLDVIRDPLLHMVRNSADHGIELPAERVAAGKPECGIIRLSAYHEGGQIVIEICDDGRGLDAGRIRARVLAGGLASEDDLSTLSDAQVYSFIFAAGFSTASQVTHLSGRGVGMDVVRNNIDRIGGTIDVRSVAARGTSIVIKIPLTLAIMPALIVSGAGGRYAVPQVAVRELIRVREKGDQRIERLRSAGVLRVENKLLPLLPLSELLGQDAAESHGSDLIVVMQSGQDSFGIIVDDVVQTAEIVVKPVSRRLRHIHAFSGMTILGDGAVIMIIDPNNAARVLGVTSKAQNAMPAAGAADQGEGGRSRESLLLFRAGPGQIKAVPVSLVARLEEIDVSQLEPAESGWLLRHRDRLVPVRAANEHVALRGSGLQPVLMFADGDRTLGLMIDEIVDIVEDRLDIEIAASQPGTVGSAIVAGCATDILDIGHHFQSVFPDWCAKAAGSAATRPQVLLVDDAAFFRDMLKPVIQAAGFEVVVASSAAGALDLIGRGGRLDVVIADTEMPGMDGFQLCEALRGAAATAHLSFIGLSARISEDIVRRGREAGFDDFVAKFDRSGLIAALKEQTAGEHAA